MPFKSEAQRRFLWATQPTLAREWAHEPGTKNTGLPAKLHPGTTVKKPKRRLSKAAATLAATGILPPEILGIDPQQPPPFDELPLDPNSPIPAILAPPDPAAAQAPPGWIGPGVAPPIPPPSGAPQGPPNAMQPKAARLSVRTRPTPSPRQNGVLSACLGLPQAVSEVLKQAAARYEPSPSVLDGLELGASTPNELSNILQITYDKIAAVLGPVGQAVTGQKTTQKPPKHPDQTLSAEEFRSDATGPLTPEPAAPTAQPAMAGLMQPPPAAPRAGANSPPVGSTLTGAPPPAGSNPGARSPSANPINSYGGISMSGEINGNASFGTPKVAGLGARGLMSAITKGLGRSAARGAKFAPVQAATSRMMGKSTGALLSIPPKPPTPAGPGAVSQIAHGFTGRPLDQPVRARDAIRSMVRPSYPGLDRPAGVSRKPWARVVSRPFDRTRQTAAHALRTTSQATSLGTAGIGAAGLYDYPRMLGRNVGAELGAKPEEANAISENMAGPVDTPQLWATALKQQVPGLRDDSAFSNAHDDVIRETTIPQMRYDIGGRRQYYPKTFAAIGAARSLTPFGAATNATLNALGTTEPPKFNQAIGRAARKHLAGIVDNPQATAASPYAKLWRDKVPPEVFRRRLPHQIASALYESTINPVWNRGAAAGKSLDQAFMGRPLTERAKLLAAQGQAIAKVPQPDPEFRVARGPAGLRYLGNRLAAELHDEPPLYFGQGERDPKASYLQQASSLIPQPRSRLATSVPRMAVDGSMPGYSQLSHGMSGLVTELQQIGLEAFVKKHPQLQSFARTIGPRLAERALEKGGAAYDFSQIVDDDRSQRRLSRLDAHDAGKNVGYLTWNEPTADSTHLEGLYVAPEHRGRGLAKQLVQQIIDKHGSRTLDLRARPYKDEGLSAADLATFYQQFGFEPTDAEGRMQRPADPVKAAGVNPEIMSALVGGGLGGVAGAGLGYASSNDKNWKRNTLAGGLLGAGAGGYGGWQMGKGMPKGLSVTPEDKQMDAEYQKRVKAYEQRPMDYNVLEPGQPGYDPKHRHLYGTGSEPINLVPGLYAPSRQWLSDQFYRHGVTDGENTVGGLLADTPEGRQWDSMSKALEKRNAAKAAAVTPATNILDPKILQAKARHRRYRDRLVGMYAGQPGFDLEGRLRASRARERKWVTNFNAQLAPPTALPAPLT